MDTGSTVTLIDSKLKKDILLKGSYPARRPILKLCGADEKELQNDGCYSIQITINSTSFWHNVIFIPQNFPDEDSSGTWVENHLKHRTTQGRTSPRPLPPYTETNHPLLTPEDWNYPCPGVSIIPEDLGSLVKCLGSLHILIKLSIRGRLSYRNFNDQHNIQGPSHHVAQLATPNIQGINQQKIPPDTFGMLQISHLSCDGFPFNQQRGQLTMLEQHAQPGDHTIVIFKNPSLGRGHVKIFLNNLLLIL